MPLLISYSFKNAFARKLTSALTVLGIGLVVFVFTAVLMLSNGLQQMLVSTGSDNNAIAIRRAATTELVSIINRGMADIIKADQGIARDEEGAPLFANEMLVLITQPKRMSNEPSNVPIRGVNKMSSRIRPGFKLVAGRSYRPGTSEIIAGKKVAETFQGCGLGETVRFGMRDWEVVGIFEADGSGFESELWGDIDQLMPAFERPVFSSCTMRLNPETSFSDMKERLESDRRLTVELLREKEYYHKQSRSTTTFIKILGLMVSIIFSIGAIVGAMITMYASVANRTVEIGTLRSLGFGRSAILSAFWIEAMIITITGGLLGLLLALSLQFIEVSTTNWDTFAETAFSFAISPAIAINAMVFSIVMGLLGGFLPAVRASRFRIVKALRAR